MSMDGDLAWFQSLSTQDVAEIVRQNGPRTVVFAAGGTSRWFLLNHRETWPSDTSYLEDYTKQGARQFLRIADLFFRHGIRTLFTHAIAPGQLQGREEGYAQRILRDGMERLAGDAQLLQFYEEAGVRVRLFGNYRQALVGSQYEDVLAGLDELERRTRANTRHRLYWGFNTARDQITPILNLAGNYCRERGQVAGREEIARLYYGEDVEPVDVFIGFNRPADLGLIPPLLGGQADLYFTVGLSFDLSQRQFRHILYDHLFARRGRHRDYSTLPANTFPEMQAFYRLNQDDILGIGRRYEPGAIWHPLPQVHLPPAWEEEGA